MRTLPTREALVAAYWRKLASSVEAAYRGRDRVLARRAARALRTARRPSRDTRTPRARQRCGQENPCQADGALTSSHVDCSFSAETALYLHGDGHLERAH